MKGNQDLAPRLHSCFLTAPPLSLHPLPSLTSSCSDLPFGTHRRLWRLASLPHKQEAGVTESSSPGAPQGPARFQHIRGDLWDLPGPAVLSLQLVVSFCAARPGHFKFPNRVLCYCEVRGKPLSSFQHPTGDHHHIVVPKEFPE